MNGFQWIGIAALSRLLLTTGPGAALQPGAAPGPSVQIMGTSANWSDSSVTGHAFVCVQVPVGSGTKEDCYGFYPLRVGSLFGGPGVVSTEFDFERTPPTRFSNVVNSISKPLTLAQRQAVLKQIQGWNRTYSLTTSNCVHFANDVARAAGLTVPSDSRYDTPTRYVAKLKELNPALK